MLFQFLKMLFVIDLDKNGIILKQKPLFKLLVAVESGATLLAQAYLSSLYSDLSGSPCRVSRN